MSRTNSSQIYVGLAGFGMSIAKSMLEKGVIDKEVLAIIDTKLLEKYRPVLGTLLAGKPLT